MPEDDEKNSVCSDDELKEEELEVKEKSTDGPQKDNEDEDNEDEDEDEDEDNEDDEDDEDDDDDDEDDDDDDEYDPTIIQYELLKNFLVDEEGTSIATHLGSIAKELRTLNKILLKKNK